MAYAKKTWALDDPITDVALNNIETGVDTAHDVLDATGTPSTLSGATANAIGTATAKAKADHTHAISSNSVPSPLAIGGVASVGTSSHLARADHQHAIPFAVGSGATDLIAGNHIRAGVYPYNWETPNSVEFTVSFGFTFPSAPTVMLTLMQGSALDVQLMLVSTTTTTMTVRADSPASGATVPLTFAWLAFVNP